MAEDPIIDKDAPDDDSGWTFVKPKGRSHRAPKPGAATKHKHSSSPPRSSEPGRPVSEIEGDYRKVRAQWETTPCCKQLRELVAVNTAAIETVCHAICFGIGTFDPPNGSWDAKRRAFVQLIAFLVMVEELERLTKKTIPCSFQEPIFTETDVAFVKSLGHEVVDSPAGFDLVDTDSLVFGIHLYRPIYASALSHAIPAIFVGTGWDTWDQVTMTKTTDLDNLEYMENHCKKSKFPRDTSTTAFSSTCIYWRPVAQPAKELDTSREENGKDSVVLSAKQADADTAADADAGAATGVDAGADVGAGDGVPPVSASPDDQAVIALQQLRL